MTKKKTILPLPHPPKNPPKKPTKTTTQHQRTQPQNSLKRIQNTIIREILLCVSACTHITANSCSSFEVKQSSRRTILLCLCRVISLGISRLPATYALKLHSVCNFGLTYSSVLVLSQEGSNESKIKCALQFLQPRLNQSETNFGNKFCSVIK